MEANDGSDVNQEQLAMDVNQEQLAMDVNQEQLAMMESKLRLERQLKSGANWFFWIAALSLINSLISVVGGDWNFILGLGVTQVIDVIAAVIAEEASSDVATVVRAIALFIDLGVLAAFVVLGIFARRGNKWFFIFGMVV